MRTRRVVWMPCGSVPVGVSVCVRVCLQHAYFRCMYARPRGTRSGGTGRGSSGKRDNCDCISCGYAALGYCGDSVDGQTVFGDCFCFFFPPLLGQGGFGLFLDRHNLRKYVEECLAQSSSMAGGELKWGSGRTGWDCVGARKGFNGTGLWW